MRDAFRLFASFVVFLATYYFIYWVPFSFFPFLHQNGVAVILSLLCAIGAARYTWQQMGSMPDGLVSTILSGAMIVGAIGFCAGFFGPIVFAPEANLAGFLGIVPMHLTTGEVIIGAGAGGAGRWFSDGGI